MKKLRIDDHLKNILSLFSEVKIVHVLFCRKSFPFPKNFVGSKKLFTKVNKC